MQFAYDVHVKQRQIFPANSMYDSAGKMRLFYINFNTHGERTGRAKMKFAYFIIIATTQRIVNAVQ